MKRMSQNIFNTVFCLFMLSWLPLLVLWFPSDSAQAVLMLATISCIFALAVYGLGLALLLKWLIVTVYNHYAISFRAIKRNQKSFNEFLRWAKANDKTII